MRRLTLERLGLQNQEAQMVRGVTWRVREGATRRRRVPGSEEVAKCLVSFVVVTKCVQTVPTSVQEMQDHGMRV